MNKKIICICGPTAVGKSKLSMLLANELDGEIISCDSMQLYKYMDIGSAKPSRADQEKVPHHIVDMIEPNDDFSVAKYKQLAEAKIDELLLSNRMPIIVGGSMLHMNSILYDMDFCEDAKVDVELREKLYEEAKLYGSEYLHKKLAKLNEKASLKIHQNNTQKLVRAIEIAMSGSVQKDFSTELKRNDKYEPILVCLTRDRAELYERINQRVDDFIKAGLIEEVIALKNMGLTKQHISMNAIGYKEVLDYLDGNINYDQMLDLIKKNTRHFAKRQLSWLRRYDDMKWFNLSHMDSEENQEICQWIKSQL